MIFDYLSSAYKSTTLKYLRIHDDVNYVARAIAYISTYLVSSIVQIWNIFCISVMIHIYSGVQMLQSKLGVKKHIYMYLYKPIYVHGYTKKSLASKLDTI